MLWTLLLASVLTQPASASAGANRRVAGFDSIVLNQVNRAMGTENLPAARGRTIDTGLFVTLAPDRMQIFDRDAAPLQGGRLTDTTVAPECRSGCSAAFYDAFQERWLGLAVESAALGIGIPTHVLFAAHAALPVATLLDAAYAAAETRPVQPPTLSLAVNSAGRGLQAIAFHLLPPEGIEIRQGAGAALGLSIAFGGGTYRVSANDPDFAVERSVRSLRALRVLAGAIKKKYPGKRTMILVPDANVSVDELVQLVGALREDFPRIVLSKGQDVILP